MQHCQTNKLSFPLREKKESIRLGEKLVVPDSDADPARGNGACLGLFSCIITVYLWHIQPGYWPLEPPTSSFSFFFLFSSVRVWK